MEDWKPSILKGKLRTALTPQSYKIPEPEEIDNREIAQQKQEQRRFKNIQNELETKYPSFEEMSAEYGSNKLDPFLETISQIESSSGDNVDHKKIEKGIHAGDSAIGRYGLMPNTIQDIVSNYNNPVSALRYRLGNDYKDADLEGLSGLDKDQLVQVLNERPELQDRMARYLATTLSQRMKDDEDRMAYGWNMGTSYRKQDVPDSSLNNNEYVRRFREYKKDRQASGSDSSLASNDSED